MHRTQPKKKKTQALTSSSHLPFPSLVALDSRLISRASRPWDTTSRDRTKTWPLSHALARSGTSPTRSVHVTLFTVIALAVTPMVFFFREFAQIDQKFSPISFPRLWNANSLLVIISPLLLSLSPLMPHRFSLLVCTDARRSTCLAVVCIRRSPPSLSR